MNCDEEFKRKSTQNKRKRRSPKSGDVAFNWLFSFFFSLLTSSFSSFSSSSLSSLFSQKRGNGGYLDESAALRYAQCSMLNANASLSSHHPICNFLCPQYRIHVQYSTVTAQHNTHNLLIISPHSNSTTSYHPHSTTCPPAQHPTPS